MAKTGTKDPVSNNNDAQYTDVYDKQQEPKANRSGDTPGTAAVQDPNDEKMMATSPGNAAGRLIRASISTLDRIVPIEDNYAAFPSSTTKSYETYTQRVDKIVSALGNKDTVRG